MSRRGEKVAVLTVDERQAIEASLQKIEDQEDLQDADAAYASYLKDGGIPFSKVKKELRLDKCKSTDSSRKEP
jgi:hypothetical protein